MKFIVENKQLEIKYLPGNGAWTYHLIIPNTKEIKGKWGDLKVSGKIDDYELVDKNLAPLKNADKKISLNSEIRSFLGKSAGEFVNVTLYLVDENVSTDSDNEMILECFKDASVLPKFEKLSVEEQDGLIKNINEAATEDQKVERILKCIAKLEQLQ